MIRCHGVGVRYGEVVALHDVDLTISAGERIALLGRSGSGKTTLLHALGGLVEPTSGTLERAPSTVSATVFQGSNLLPYFTAFENVAFAAHISGGEKDPRFAPQSLLQLVGLGGKGENLPAELSGGEAQRVALARSLALKPDLLLCDEPTGHLDSDTGARVLALIDALQAELGFALVLATHDADVAARLSREVELHDGAVVREEVHA